MIQATVETAATVYAYASLIGDNELLSKVDYSPSYLKNLRDTELKAVCQSVHTAASSVISELDDYGKTQEDLDKLQKEINDFSDMLSQSRKAISTRATATSRLEELFEETDDLLKNQLDKLMITYKNSHPRFYNTYKKARQIVDMGKHSRTEEPEPEV
jgi:uncharacterized protein YecE (DUF72 family)